MASFLERFKGKTNLISKDGVFSSLEKPSVPIKKQVEAVNYSKSSSLNPITTPIKGQVFSLPNKLIHSQKTSSSPEVENGGLASQRVRKVKSLTTSQVVKARKVLTLNPETVVVRTETDIIPNPGSNPAVLDPKKQKSAPVSTRNSPAGFKEKPKFGSYYQPKLMGGGKKAKSRNLTIEEIQEKEELEEIQKGHFNYLSKVEKMY